MAWVRLLYQVADVMIEAYADMVPVCVHSMCQYSFP
jgi:hypothetical protein